ncbi:hypothetical protein CR105_25410 [Massilia eurypsychrophila]|jgi:hypothetical protein|uniref:Uncharacterized protein n=1 Tax=Massilia eurypsychrophila TaxID=1485217 RepID=A0A2G8T846_9BURK|nr:hypothetical protein [Massilia eurypsychrophila]PIL42211.1 hypothetical protein CR105_25410 [Massilia eurypsychrophila]
MAYKLFGNAMTRWTMAFAIALGLYLAATLARIETVYHVNTADYLVHMETQQAIFLAMFGRFTRAGIEFAQPTRTVRLVEDSVAQEANVGPRFSVRR